VKEIVSRRYFAKVHFMGDSEEDPIEALSSQDQAGLSSRGRSFGPSIVIGLSSLAQWDLAIARIQGSSTA
jgi:hypothetical protein